MEYLKYFKGRNFDFANFSLNRKSFAIKRPFAKVN